MRFTILFFSAVLASTQSLGAEITASGSQFAGNVLYGGGRAAPTGAQVSRASQLAMTAYRQFQAAAATEAGVVLPKSSAAEVLPTTAEEVHFVSQLRATLGAFFPSPATRQALVVVGRAPGGRSDVLNARILSDALEFAEQNSPRVSGGGTAISSFVSQARAAFGPIGNNVRSLLTANGAVREVARAEAPMLRNIRAALMSIVRSPASQSVQAAGRGSTGQSARMLGIVGLLLIIPAVLSAADDGLSAVDARNRDMATRSPTGIGRFHASGAFLLSSKLLKPSTLAYFERSYFDQSRKLSTKQISDEIEKRELSANNDQDGDLERKLAIIELMGWQDLDYDRRARETHDLLAKENWSMKYTHNRKPDGTYQLWDNTVNLDRSAAAN